MLPLLLMMSAGSWALPAPLLGPDGPVWFGTVSPRSAHEFTGHPLAVVVDPRSGALSLVERDRADVIREWDGRRWTVDGGGVTAEWPPRDGLSYSLTDDGELESATSAEGVRRRYFYDETGLLTGVLWPDGGRLVVRYDDNDRVARLDGPGPARTTFDWGQRGDVAVQDALGRVTRVGPVPPGDMGVKAWEVQDPAGRVVRTWFADEASEEVAGWQDPRGRYTRVSRGDSGIEVQGPTGSVWRVVLDDTGRPAALTDPLGSVWRWERDAVGRLRRITDPTGRVTVWTRDADGRVRVVDRSGQGTLLERDERGRVKAIRDPTGGEVALERDAAGRIVALTDPGGSVFHLTRDSFGRVTAMVSRTDGRWSFAYDLLGRVNRVVDPTDRIVNIERDTAGRVVGVKDNRGLDVGLGRSADGQITAVASRDGRTLGLIRDAIGRITALRLPSSVGVEIERDAAGDISAVVGPWGVVRVMRDGRGLPTDVGPSSWGWDGAARLDEVGLGSVKLAVRRDSAGRLEGLRSGSWFLEVGRDGAGRPISWRGTDAPVVVQRDPSGRITSEQTVHGTATLTWDLRGDVEGASVEGLGWRWLRDGAGRALRVSGPSGLQLGTDHDPAGRPRLLRLPGGSLVRWSYEGDLAHMSVLDADGQMITERTEARDIQGELLWWQQDTGDRVSVDRDLDGRVIGQRSGEQPLWSFASHAMTGPDSELVTFDEKGQLRMAHPAAGPAAWGVGQNEIRAQADSDTGRLLKVVGENGETMLAWDEVGRLTSVSTPVGVIRVVRDARGRVAGWSSSATGVVPLVWMPADSALEATLLSSGAGGQRVWVSSTRGPAGFADGDLKVGIATDLEGDPIAVQSGRDPALSVRHSPTGFPDSGAAGLVGANGWLQPFAGGPLLRMDESIDPVGGRRLAGLSTWPWGSLSVRGTKNRVDLRDPTHWLPQSPWGDPLRVMTALGALERVDDVSWWLPSSDALAVSWLPQVVDGISAPIGPPNNAVPFAEDLLARCAIQSVLPGNVPLSAADPLRAILASEIDLEGLPPGIPVPGLEWLTAEDVGCGVFGLASPTWIQ